MKCNYETFSKTGFAYLVVDGELYGAPRRYQGGEDWIVNFFVDPVQEGYKGRHKYHALVLPEAQWPGIISGYIWAWEERE
jgi:hypothetical protein